MTNIEINKIKKRIEKQQIRENKKVGNYISTMKKPSKVNYTTNSIYNYLNHKKVFYSYTRWDFR